MHVHSSGRAVDYQTLRAMAYATFGGAVPGEGLTTAERIDDGDAEGWQDSTIHSLEDRTVSFSYAG